MALVEGWDGNIKVGANAMANMSHFKINFVQESIDNTAYGTTVQDRSFLPGLRAHTVEFSGLYNGSSGQLTLTGKMKKGGTPSLTSMSFITTGSKGYKGAILVESIGVDSNVDGVVAFSGSGKASGGLSTV
jgi:hypothetical protein